MINLLLVEKSTGLLRLHLWFGHGQGLGEGGQTHHWLVTLNLGLSLA